MPRCAARHYRYPCHTSSLACCRAIRDGWAAVSTKNDAAVRREPKTASERQRSTVSAMPIAAADAQGGKALLALRLPISYSRW